MRRLFPHFCLFLLLQLHCHFLFIAGINHDFLVAFDAVESGDLPLAVALYYHQQHSWVAFSHIISHPNNVLGRPVALVPYLTMRLMRFFVSYHHVIGRHL